MARPRFNASQVFTGIANLGHRTFLVSLYQTLRVTPGFPRRNVVLLRLAGLTPGHTGWAMRVHNDQQ